MPYCACSIRLIIFFIEPQWTLISLTPTAHEYIHFNIFLAKNLSEQCTSNDVDEKSNVHLIGLKEYVNTYLSLRASSQQSALSWFGWHRCLHEVFISSWLQNGRTPKMRVLCLTLHGWLIFPSWPPFVWHWPPPPPHLPLPQIADNPACPPAINAKAWRGPLWGLEVIPGLFFFSEGRGLRWQVWWDLGGGGGWSKCRVVCIGLNYSHRLSGFLALFLLNLSKHCADNIRCFYKTITHDEIVLLDN